MKLGICKECNKEFVKCFQNSKICKDCNIILNKVRKFRKICVVCKKNFIGYSSMSKCCSHECKMNLPCIKCGNVSRYSNGQCKYCSSKWHKDNPDKTSNNTRKHIAKKKSLYQEPYNFNLICKFYDNKCVCCNKKKKLTVDHVIPISWDNCPGDIPSNIQPLCKSCNCSKCNYHATDYRWDKGIEMLKYLECQMVCIGPN